MGRLLVDGYNVIRRDPVLRELEQRDPLAARADLLRLLNHHSLNPWEVLVIFDGAPPLGERPVVSRARVIHSRGESADVLIVSLCGPHDVVVTDDQGLRASTLLAGPQVWSVEKLLRRVSPAARRVQRRLGQSAEEPARPAPPAPGLRTFAVCPRCKFYDRDDWIMLCEEDGALGRPRNFREEW